ncbi:MAG TPA: autotransporter domain-containing protein [Candidatus Aphodousia faecipullorum]|nr:autotransporter domain-containing protein [Candidatus Aphodousia faecipullorum]
MNKTFKVIFSKARNALMVVNEATGSVQAKGTKSVIATAIATALMASGSAMAVTTQGNGAAAVSFDGQQLIKAKNTEAILNVDFKDGVITVNELSAWSTPEGKVGQGALNNLSFDISDEVASVAMIVQGGETGGVISGNESNNRGGAMTIYQNQATEQLKHQISGITFEKNIASVAGGAIAFGKWGIEGSTKVAAQLTNNQFNENSAQNGGAAYLENAEVTFADSSFTGNSATEFGGAIYVDQSSSVVVDNIEFTDNSVESEDKGNGGAIFSLNGNVQVNESTFTKNTSERNGGAIAIASDNVRDDSVQQLSISNSEFVSNTAKQKGGAVFWYDYETNDRKGDLAIEQTTFKDNKANMGGAIYAENAFTVTGSQFTKNQATDDGGAIYAYTTADFAISNSVFQENTSGDNGGAIAAWADNGQDQNYSVTNSQFTENEATDKGGAISWLEYESIHDGASHVLSVEGSTFNSNTAQWGGAINTEAELSVKDTTFVANTAEDDGGAIDASRTAQFSINGARFEQNTAGDNGGAINAWADNQLERNNTITNSQFIGNKATDKGGAIAWLAVDPLWDDVAHNITVENSTFDSNSAQWGGAINTEGEITLRGETNFVGNTASQQGGAIFVSETGTLNVEGTAVFADNTANNIPNDIHNEGTVNVAGSLTLDGGISGDGTTNFGEKSSLNVHVGFNQNDSTTISNDVVIADGASLGFVFAPGYTGKYELFTGDIEGEFILTDDNTVFDVSLNEDGSYQVSQKSTDAITESTGANVNQSRAIRAILSDYSGSNEMFNNIAESVALGIQSSNASDRQAALDAVTALSTEAAPVIAQTQTDTATQVYAAVGSRFELTNTQEPGSNLWVQGLFSTGDYDDNGTAKGYDTDSNGIAFGLDSAVTDSVKVGVGFAYTNTDIDGFLRDTDVESKTAFIYGQYKPSNWYVNGIMSYGWSSYDESKHVAGFNVGADYDVETFGLQAMTGYDFEVAGINVTPEAGLRYFRISQDGYTDAAGSTVGSEDNDVLTAVVGAKVNKAWEVSPSVVIKPQARLAMTYDLVDADNNSVITLANGATYRVEGETMDRFGVEVDVGVAAEVTDNFEFALTYSGNFRGDFQNHAGLINAKYKF